MYGGGAFSVLYRRRVKITKKTLLSEPKFDEKTVRNWHTLTCCPSSTSAILKNVGQLYRPCPIENERATPTHFNLSVEESISMTKPYMELDDRHTIFLVPSARVH